MKNPTGLALCVLFLHLLAGGAQEQSAFLKPVTVCEVIQNLKEYDEKAVAVVGRFSYRSDGRWISQDGCAPTSGADQVPQTALIWLSLEAQSAPRLAGGYQLDGTTTSEKLQLMKKRTTLKQFRFGTPDYDRWAVVYGQIKLLDKSASAARKDAPAQLIYAGDGYVMFLRDTPPSRAGASH